MLFNTYSRSQKQRQHTQPGSLKYQIKTQRTSRRKKKNPSKRQLFHLPRPMLYNVRSTDTFQLLQVVSSTYSSKIYMAGFAKKQFHPQNSLYQTRSFFFNQNIFYRIPNQNVLFKASFFFITFSLHSKMIVMQQFNDKNILIFYYTAARS